MASLDYPPKIAVRLRQRIHGLAFSLLVTASYALGQASPPKPDADSAVSRTSQLRSAMVGQTVADLTFTAADGKQTQLASYRGKPVLIDLWATWCAPCLIALPSIKHVFTDFKDKGLGVISVDQDKVPARATEYLAQHHYKWTNFHDGDRSVERAMKGYSLPLTVLIDANGKIVYYDLESNEAALRKAIAGLGPEFASVPTFAAAVGPSPHP
jgi:thiol-disulfide isomerase/thioredoxin